MQGAALIGVTVTTYLSIVAPYYHIFSLVNDILLVLFERGLDHVEDGESVLGKLSVGKGNCESRFFTRGIEY